MWEAMGMSRALRRHPLNAKPTKRPGPLRTPRPAKGAPPSGTGKGWRGLFRPRWAEDIISELRKVTWPTRQETVNLTIVVIVVAVAIGLLLGGIDEFFNWLITHTILS
jgi:preprotein translocase SecE subunit